MSVDVDYEKLSKSYDAMELIFFFGGRGNPRKGFPKIIPNESLEILDLCTGTALSSILLASQNDKNIITGVDISEGMLQQARRKINDKGIRNIKLHKMSADNLKFPDHSFDIIMISFALHEMEIGLRTNIFKEVKRLLKRNGRFIVLDFAHQKGAMNRLFNGIWKKLEPAVYIDFLSNNWHRELEEEGLKLKNTSEYSFSNIYEFIYN